MPHRTVARARHLACLLLPLALATTARAADPLESQADLQKMFDDKQYKELVPKLSKALTLKGPAAAGYDRHALLEMKGEASLQLKSKSAAMDAFKLAAKATDDADAAKRDAALAILAREASSNMTYTPKTGTPKGEKPEPIDILAPDGRKSAFQALEADLLAKAKPGVEAAKKSSSLQQIMAAARTLGDIRPVEFMADGGDGDVNGLLGDLGNRVCKLLDDDMEHTAEALDSEVTTYNAQNKAGEQAQARNSIMSLSRDAHAGNVEVVQVQEVAKQMPSVFGAVTDFKPTEERAGKLHELIGKLRKSIRESGWPNLPED
jgi:hypothetical protein